MTATVDRPRTAMAVLDTPPRPSEQHLVEKLIERLPRRAQAAAHWLRQPSSRWARVPAGVLLVGGGFIGMLPFFGFWMLPLGLFLLAEDAPPLRRARDRLLARIERHRPHWFSGEAASSPETGAPTQSPTRPDTHA